LTKALATRVRRGGSTGAIAPRANPEFSLGLAAVRDFLVTRWFIFNLADIAVVAGILGFVAVYWRPRQPDSRIMRS